MKHFRNICSQLHEFSHASVYNCSSGICMIHTTVPLNKEFKFQYRPPGVKNKDVIGPPDKISNLRPIIYRTGERLSPIEKSYHEKCENISKWNQDFWTRHNKNFIQAKEKFTEQRLKSRPKDDKSNLTLSSDEMSDFYKQFLDENYRLHVRYNIEWYKKNISLIVPAMTVALYRISAKLRSHK